MITMHGSTIERETTKYTFSTESSHQQFGHGELFQCTYFKGLSKNNTIICIINCHIAHNQTVWRAGFLIDMLGNAKGNELL